MAKEGESDKASEVNRPVEKGSDNAASESMRSAPEEIKQQRKEMSEQKNTNRPPRPTTRLLGRPTITGSDGKAIVDGAPAEEDGAPAKDDRAPAKGDPAPTTDDRAHHPPERGRPTRSSEAVDGKAVAGTPAKDDVSQTKDNNAQHPPERGRPARPSQTVDGQAVVDERTELAEKARAIHRLAGYDNAVFTYADTKEISNLLRDLPPAQLEGLKNEYKQLPGGHNLEADLAQCKGFKEGSDKDVLKGLFHTDDASRAAITIHKCLTEHGESVFTGRSSWAVDKDLRLTLSSLTARQLEDVKTKFQELYPGDSLGKAFSQCEKLPQDLKDALPYYLKGLDHRTPEDSSKLAQIALGTSNLEMFKEVMSTSSEDARKQFLADDGEQKMKEAFGSLTDHDLKQAQSYARGDKNSAVVQEVTDNTGSKSLGFFSNREGIYSALDKLSEEQRRTYFNGKELANPEHKAPLTPTEQEARDFYNQLHGAMEKAVRPAELHGLEDRIAIKGGSLISEISKGQGYLYNSGADVHMSTIANMTEQQWTTLHDYIKGANCQPHPKYEAELSETLKAMKLGQDHIDKITKLFREKLNCDTFAAAQAVGKPKDINATLTDYASRWTGDSRDVIHAIEQAFKDDPALHGRIKNPQNDGDRAISERFKHLAEKALGSDRQYAQKLIESADGRLSLADKIEMNRGSLSNDRQAVLRDLSDALKSDPKLVENNTQLRDQILKAMDGWTENEAQRDVAKRVIAHGKVEPEDLLRSHILDYGHTDQIMGLLRKMTPDELDRASKHYAEQYHSDLQADLQIKLSGNERNEAIRQFWRPASAADLFDHVKHEYLQSRSGFGSAFADNIGGSGTGYQLDNSINHMAGVLADAQRSGQPPSADQRQELLKNIQADVSGFTQDLANFQASKGACAEYTANAVMSAIAVAGAAESGGASLSLLARVGRLASTAGGNALVNVGLQMAMLGSDYDWSVKRVASDLGSGAVDGMIFNKVGAIEVGAMLGIGEGAARATAGSAVKELMEKEGLGLAKTLSSNEAKAAFQTALQNELGAAIRQGVVQGEKQISEQALEQAANNALRKVFTDEALAGGRKLSEEALEREVQKGFENLARHRLGEQSFNELESQLKKEALHSVGGGVVEELSARQLKQYESMISSRLAATALKDVAEPLSRNLESAAREQSKNFLRNLVDYAGGYTNPAVRYLKGTALAAAGGATAGSVTGALHGLENWDLSKSTEENLTAMREHISGSILSAMMGAAQMHTISMAAHNVFRPQAHSAESAVSSHEESSHRAEKFLSREPATTAPARADSSEGLTSAPGDKSTARARDSRPPLELPQAFNKEVRVTEDNGRIVKLKHLFSTADVTYGIDGDLSEIKYNRGAKLERTGADEYKFTRADRPDIPPQSLKGKLVLEPDGTVKITNSVEVSRLSLAGRYEQHSNPDFLQHWSGSATVKDAADRALLKLPFELREQLARNGIKVVIVDELAGLAQPARPDVPQPRLFELATRFMSPEEKLNYARQFTKENYKDTEGAFSRDQKVVAIAENKWIEGLGSIRNDNLAGVARHEFFHGVSNLRPDAISSADYLYSDLPKFKTAFEQDCRRIEQFSQAERKQLEYFTGDREEAFAEVAAALHGGGGRTNVELIKRAFPDSAAAIKEQLAQLQAGESSELAGGELQPQKARERMPEHAPRRKSAEPRETSPPETNLHEPDAVQRSLQTGKLELKERLGGTLGSEHFIMSGEQRQPDGQVRQIIFHCVDATNNSTAPGADRFRKENAAYKLNQMLDLGNGFPPTALSSDQEITIQGKPAKSSLKGWIQERQGESLESALLGMAETTYGKSRKPHDDVVKLVREQPEIKQAIEKAFVERLIYGDKDNHTRNFIMVKEGGQLKVKNIDLEEVFVEDRAPVWQRRAAGTPLTSKLHDEFSGQEISPEITAKIHQFVEKYNTPEGISTLSTLGLTHDEISGLLGRADYLAKRGRFPVTGAGDDAGMAPAGRPQAVDQPPEPSQPPEQRDQQSDQPAVRPAPAPIVDEHQLKAAMDRARQCFESDDWNALAQDLRKAAESTGDSGRQLAGTLSNALHKAGLLGDYTIEGVDHLDRVVLKRTATGDYWTARDGMDKQHAVVFRRPDGRTERVLHSRIGETVFHYDEGGTATPVRVDGPDGSVFEPDPAMPGAWLQRRSDGTSRSLGKNYPAGADNAGNYILKQGEGPEAKVTGIVYLGTGTRAFTYDKQGALTSIRNPDGSTIQRSERLPNWWEKLSGATGDSVLLGQDLKVDNNGKVTYRQPYERHPGGDTWASVSEDTDGTMEISPDGDKPSKLSRWLHGERLN